MKITLFDTKIEKFTDSLENLTVAKVLRTVDLLETFGGSLGLPHSKKIKRNLYELRIRGKQEVRIFYTIRRNEVILLHGFIKKTQTIPYREIRNALQKLKMLDC